MPQRCDLYLDFVRRNLTAAETKTPTSHPAATGAKITKIPNIANAPDPGEAEGANAKHISSTSGSPLRKNVKIQNGRPSGTSGGTQVLIATAIRAAAPNATAARYIIGQPPWRAVDTIKCAAFRWRTIPSEWCGWFLRPGACGAGWRRRRQTASRGRYCSCRRRCRRDRV